jgi:hypothetical protein
MNPITRRRFLTVVSVSAVGAAVAAIVPFQDLRQISIFDAEGIVASQPIMGSVSTFKNIRGLIIKTVVHTDGEVFTFALDTPVNLWDGDTLEITWRAPE